MGKIDFLKTSLKCGVLSSNLLNCNAMQENCNDINKIITFQDYFLKKNDKEKDKWLNSINSKTRRIIDQKKLNDIITIEKMEELINDYKEDILSPLTLGYEAQKNAYYLGISLHEKIEKFLNNNKNISDDEFEEYKNYLWIKKDEYENKDKNYKEKLNKLENFFRPIIEDFKSKDQDSLIYKINKNFDFSNLLFVKKTKKYNNNRIKNIGRDVLHGITTDIYKDTSLGTDKLISEFKRIRNGEINCTINATLLYTFFKLNGYMCDLSYTYNHEFVLIKCRDDKNKTIDYFTIDLKEKNRLEKMYFYTENILFYDKDDEIWDGMFKFSCSGKTDDLFYTRCYTPTYIYYKDFVDILHNVLSKGYDIQLITYYLNGLRNCLNYLKKKNYTNGKNIWDIRFLPRIGNTCYFILNIDDLGEYKFVDFKFYSSFYEKEITYKTVLFKSIKENNKYIDLHKVSIRLPELWWRDKYMDGKIKIIKQNLNNSTLEYEIIDKNGNVIVKDTTGIDGTRKGEVVKVY